MAKYPIMPFFTDAFLSDTIHLSDAETGSYITLLTAAWRSHDCRLKDDDAYLARAARCSMRVWMASRRAAMAQFFTIEDGYWTQKRQLEERAKVEVRSNAASKKSKTRWGAKPLENKDTDDAGALPEQSSPLTINSLTNVSSPPEVPHDDPEPVAEPEPDPDPDPEPQFELVAPDPTGTVLVAYGSTPNLPAVISAVPYEAAAAIWNETCGDLLPNAKSWPKGRMRAFAMRFKNNCNGNLQVWREVCERVRSSAFCCGDNDRGWRADIDFALQESSWAKIIEGKYDNITRRQKPTGVIGALALLREKDIRDGRHPEDDGMSDYERELLSRPSWQDALEGPKH